MLARYTHSATASWKSASRETRLRFWSCGGTDWFVWWTVFQFCSVLHWALACESIPAVDSLCTKESSCQKPKCVYLHPERRLLSHVELPFQMQVELPVWIIHETCIPSFKLSYQISSGAPYFNRIPVFRLTSFSVSCAMWMSFFSPTTTWLFLVCIPPSFCPA